MFFIFMVLQSFWAICLGKHNKIIFSIHVCAKETVISEIFLFPSWSCFFLGPQLAPHPLEDDVMPVGSSPTQLELK